MPWYLATDDRSAEGNLETLTGGNTLQTITERALARLADVVRHATPGKGWLEVDVADIRLALRYIDYLEILARVTATYNDGERPTTDQVDID